MRGITILLGLIVICALGWLGGAALAPDAIGVAVGLLFGFLGGVMVAMLLLANRRQRVDEDETDSRPAYWMKPVVSWEEEIAIDDIGGYLAEQVDLRGGRIEATDFGYRHIWEDGTRKIYQEAH